jgi:G3E family GTPase
MATRVAIIGGFLGAGKTTLLTNLAKEFASQGRSVAVITNDQGEVLVDTQFAKQLGIETKEVLKGCFCCKFPDFIDSARKLVESVRPDIIMAEPVGSCTDLLATVVAPLKFRFPSEFEVAPLVVLLDATTVEKGIEEQGSLGAYLRRHQVQEAEVIVLTKTDLMPPYEMGRITAVVKEVNPGAHVIPYSAVTKRGLKEIAAIITSTDRSERRPVDVDYDLYAQAEAELGWYNGTYRFRAERDIDSYDLAMKVMKGVASEYNEGAIAHVKLLLTSEKNTLKMSLVLGSIGVDGVKGSRSAQGECVLNLNARVVSTPDELLQVMRRSAQGALHSMKVEEEGFEDDCFSPGRPRPTYRLTHGDGT